MTTYAANPDALGNIRNGHKTFIAGIRDKEQVLRAHLAWDRGTAADFHFAWGYREAATDAHASIGDSLDYVGGYLGLGDLALPDRIRRLEILCEEQIKRYGRAPAQWQLDKLRAA